MLHDLGFSGRSKGTLVTLESHLHMTNTGIVTIMTALKTKWGIIHSSPATSMEMARKAIVPSMIVIAERNSLE